PGGTGGSASGAIVGSQPESHPRPTSSSHRLYSNAIHLRNEREGRVSGRRPSEGRAAGASRTGASGTDPIRRVSGRIVVAVDGPAGAGKSTAPRPPSRRRGRAHAASR